MTFERPVTRVINRRKCGKSENKSKKQKLSRLFKVYLFGPFAVSFERKLYGNNKNLGVVSCVISFNYRKIRGRIFLRKKNFFEGEEIYVRNMQRWERGKESIYSNEVECMEAWLHHYLLKWLFLFYFSWKYKEEHLGIRNMFKWEIC